MNVTNTNTDCLEGSLNESGALPLLLVLHHARSAGASQASSTESLLSLILTGKSLLHDIQCRLSSSGLNFMKLGTLLVLDASPDPILTPACLAGHVQVSRSAMTEILDSMETHGWIQRERGTRDRRQIIVQVTQLGRQALKVGLHELIQSAELLIQDLDEAARRRLVLICDQLRRKSLELNGKHF